ncbi:MAG: hypothetical protein K8I29_06715 [Alphaproteobacteria bacterium]|uniref:Uncharacterized protein n=1 Tax=Candidatus Nitrobium versatile TaxID=2884831 RepID=A0A953J768_9BACT|nr:hypothetical protein [Candidatus Nitrobium versatile]
MTFKIMSVLLLHEKSAIEFKGHLLVGWRNGELVHRGAVAALLRVERKFRRIKGCREIPKLLVALQQKDIDRKEVAA